MPRFLPNGLSGFLCASAMALTLTAPAWSQDKYPSRNVEIILPYAAGGGVDAMGRAFARGAAQLAGGQWVVVNRDGAAGMLGFSALANAPADGHTLVFSPASPLVITPFVTKTMPFKLDKIEPVCQVFENVFAVVVTQDSPIRSMKDLVERAKASPGKLSYGHAGTGSVPHLSVASIEKTLGIKFNPIPYRGDGALMPQLIGGQLDFAAPAMSSISGRGLRVLAVMSDKPHPGAPEAPTLSQLGYPSVVPGLNGVYVPVGTSKALVDQLQGICQKVTESEDFRKTAQTLQQTTAYLPGAAFKARLEKVSRENAELIPSIGLEKN
ncbi:MAG: tripartite tricarboxylate transporter substrate binding protein [Comamonadaceae bacterium]|nr:tripartite tricarboxylate transporter substrate binding protein [Comamonadaceae bacterium]